jgi:hypothetical protein
MCVEVSLSLSAFRAPAEDKADEQHFACVANLISLLFNYSEPIACVTGIGYSHLSTSRCVPEKCSQEKELF